MFVAMLWNKKHHKYTGPGMRPTGKKQVYTNLPLLAEGLKNNTAFYSDTEDLEVHIFKLNNYKALDANTFWAIGGDIS